MMMELFWPKQSAPGNTVRASLVDQMAKADLIDQMAKADLMDRMAKAAVVAKANREKVFPRETAARIIVTANKASLY